MWIGWKISMEPTSLLINYFLALIYQFSNEMKSTLKLLFYILVWNGFQTKNSMYTSGDISVRKHNWTPISKIGWHFSWHSLRHNIVSTCATKQTFIEVNIFNFSIKLFRKIRMQMKMDKKPQQKFDKQQIRRILEFENEFISTLFDSFEVPDSIEGKTISYILKFSIWLIFVMFLQMKVLKINIY